MSELQCVKFGDMAEQITTKVNPKDTSLDTYVGLEHLDTGSFRINRRGTPQDVIGEKLQVCKGDIIFGKRRVYQRKVAIADFDGICSAHAMVLRPKEDIVDKDFFPFFMQSDLFMERALQISVGSLSPTINWKTLAEQEFSIPLLPEQRRIATTLWAAEDCIVKGDRFVAVAERAKQVLMGELFSKGIGHREFQKTSAGMLPKGWKIASIKDIGDFKTGPFGTLLKAAEYTGSDGIPLICMRDIRDGRLEIDEKTPRIPSSVVKRMPEYLLKCGDIVFGRKGNINRSAIVNDHQDGWFLGTDGIRIRPSKEFYPPFISYHFQRDEIQSHLLHQATGTTMASLNQEILHRMYIPVPSLPEQHQIAAILTRCDETIAAARANVAAAKALKMKMINEMLGV